MLDDLAAFDAKDLHRVELDGVSCRGDAGKRSGVCPAPADPNHDLVALGERVQDLSTKVGEAIREFARERLQPSNPLRYLRVVAAELGGNVALQALVPMLVEDLDDEGWESDVRAMIARFRLEFGRHATEPSFVALVRDLSEARPEFARLWALQDVRGDGDGLKRFRHPVAGSIAFEHATFVVDEAPDLRLVVYTPAT